MFSHANLRVRAQQIEQDYPDKLGLRVHRALSWVERAELCEDDDDARFIFLWIALNLGKRCADPTFLSVSQ